MLDRDTEYRLLPDAVVAKRYSKCTKTLRRWDQAPELGFPKPVMINGRRHRSLRELQEFERRVAARSAAGA